jgi:hypothetical protein
MAASFAHHRGQVAGVKAAAVRQVIDPRQVVAQEIRITQDV